ncbi:MAG: hypothetical protein V1754_15005 [Pseudomonadota bacterium]
MPNMDRDSHRYLHHILLKEIAKTLNVITVLHFFKEDEHHVVVEISGRFVSPIDYENTQLLQEGNHMEVIYPGFGG